MYYLVLILATAALAGSATVDRHLKLLDIDNHIQANDMPETRSKRFVRLTEKPASRIAHTPGTTLELTCEAIGSPAPSVHWFRNDAPLYEYDKESNELIESNPFSLGRISSTLLVSRTNVPTRYTCLVLAGANTDRASTVVYSTDGSTDTSERSKLVPLSPRVLVSYKVLMDSIGGIVVLPCAARGHPRPKVTWTNSDGRDVTEEPRMKVLRSGELVISPLRWSDMGDYTCRATNLFGSSEVTTFLYPAKPNDTVG